LTLSELVREARSSIGSFYARFRDKDALLELLDERYTEQACALAARYAAGRDPDLAAAATRLVRMLIEFHRERRGLIRALVLKARSQREPLWEERTARMNESLPVLLGPLLTQRGEIAHPDPERALFLAFGFTFAALRERILFPESVRDSKDEDPTELERELTTFMVAYLQRGPVS
jgi:AcrR family transcriptional regulator